jgi:recombination protein RecA
MVRISKKRKGQGRSKGRPNAVNGSDGDGRDGLYFASPRTGLKFIHTGCTLLDCVLGGGWPLSRVSNVVGDKSTGKTLLAIEASANFAQQYPKGLIRYREAEAAFIPSYAEALGMPLDRVELWDEEEMGKPFATVETFEEDLKDFLRVCREDNLPGLYIVDSLDALSDNDELERKTGEATYGTAKSKAMSQMFRKLVREIESADVHLMVISQVRDNIGAMFAASKYKRSGGHALDFYATHVIYLTHLKTMVRTVSKVKRVTGVRIGAKCTKNKVSLPMRSCDFDLMFGFGLDDLGAALRWLDEVGRLGSLGYKAKSAKDILAIADEMEDTEYRDFTKEIGEQTRVVWADIEKGFLPKRRKYDTHVT